MRKSTFIFLFSFCLAIKTEGIYDNSYALIIGINNYVNARELDYAVKDAEAIQSMLTEIFQFKQGNITLLKMQKPIKTGSYKNFPILPKKQRGTTGCLFSLLGMVKRWNIQEVVKRGIYCQLKGIKIIYI